MRVSSAIRRAFRFVIRAGATADEGEYDAGDRPAQWKLGATSSNSRRHGSDGWQAPSMPIIDRALVQLQRKPAHAWTLDELAEVAGLSRSSLTDRSTRYLGQAPMTYLTQWRLELAAEALRTTNRSVLEIASDVGYESEAALNRAFKRSFSLPPRYRKRWREGGAAVQRLRSSSPRDARVPRLDRSDYTSRRRIPTDSEISSINTVG
jgi:AraC-like DNA-binding protein